MSNAITTSSQVSSPQVFSPPSMKTAHSLAASVFPGFLSCWLPLVFPPGDIIRPIAQSGEAA